MTAQPQANLAAGDPLAHVRRTFIARLGDLCLAIDAILERDGGRGIGPEDRAVIIHHAHKTAGIAASLGFAELGTLASAVETTWERVATAASELGHALDVTHRFLDEIERILDEDMLG